MANNKNIYQKYIITQMIDIKFNTGKTFDKGGDIMSVKNLYEIKVAQGTKKEDLPWLQMFNSGKRETKDTTDWSKWNGCVYSDIDSKHYYDECRHFNVDVLKEKLLRYLQDNYWYNFYALQLSNSGTGFHILFYFNVNKTETNFKKCNQFTQDVVKEAFEQISAGEIYNWKGVADKCSRSPFQGMYVTPQEWVFTENENNDNKFGSWIYSDIDKYELRPELVHKVSDVRADGSKLFALDKYIKCNEPVPYQGHRNRWAIYDALVAVCGTQQLADKAWSETIVPLLKNEEHSDSFLLNEPTKNRWFERYTTEYVKVDRLQQFGYSFRKTFEPQEISLYNPDKVYNLNENERLSDINIDWSLDKINHLYAGCSLGKTYNAKELGKDQSISDIDYAFGARNNRVCFISPMQSINKDSFSEVEGWAIIDSDHRDENIGTYGSIDSVLNSKLNICTTWESFVKQHMYELDFDFVILDECHTFYMYDYRIISITEIKQYLPLAHGIKIIMTGTPSMEVNEFDCYRIQVNKTLKEVPCDVVFYNKSFRGYYMNDIKEWVKDKNHYALIFEDYANYKYEHLFKCYGLSCDIFNKSYEECANHVLDTHNVRSQITVFSVYGQAGINLYLDNDKKVRIYILNKNALGIIQYANRLRNREVIDKVVIGYKYSDLNNDLHELNQTVDYLEAEHRVDMLNSIQKHFDIFQSKTRDILKIKFGLNPKCLDTIDGTYSLNNRYFKTYQEIQNVNEFEKQIQVIYNRLINNNFKMSFKYLDKDVKDCRNTKMRNNTFAGQLSNFNYEMFQQDKNGSWWLNPTEDFKKICTGDLIDNLEIIWNELSVGRGFEETKGLFEQWIVNVIATKKTICKKDITDFAQLLIIKRNWDTYYNNAFLSAMKYNNWEIGKLAAVYIRSIYNDKLDWKMIATEVYDKMKDLKNIVNTYPEEIPDTQEPLNIPYDKITQEIFKYIVRQHDGNKKPITINNVTYNSVTEASNILGVHRKTIYKWLKQQK